MSELLTTGEMIDRLKVGQLAEVEKKAQIPKDYWRSYKHVTKIPNGDIKWCTETGTISPSEPLILYGHTVNWIWRILPSYVSFEEAMQALKEGKMVKLHRNNNLDVTVFRKWYRLETREDVTFDDLFNGKWTIEED
ncbi:hypothetical protein [Oceanobacillus indicireducens]|uniref:Uncharacterized protein n=1 Tax=Oceanobacillus indicireducens TaxID=1004261 RepID=A0A918D3R7_9BACI|nr:hypothetical protein [Oceanobacillus indicireducens]GGN64416.1 hypothetical protein GCM10007971_32290 [Oceanobacillus indicireducens]